MPARVTIASGPVAWASTTTGCSRQAATLAEYLAETHGEKLPAVVTAFNKGRSANTIVTEVLGTDFVSLTRGWAGHVKRQAAAVEARRAGGI